ncbi:DNA polymerase [Sulfurifustis variabilis]|uniref:Error-prone DNA polymerase n=1 Tax=Sulfurifustis variabilis TaxID=1675686 RepID=A0A1B4V479_9GAMM|nr:PHP domain-containing protein [Sulfurifustis variabilis]BAU47352.1 DNA polymerase [Sulfurifustis variabilis]
MAASSAYAELHCLSNFSFLRGASHPEELVARAKQLGYSALALTDECSLAGVVRAHLAAREYELKLLIGAEFRLSEEQTVIPSPQPSPAKAGEGELSTPSPQPSPGMAGEGEEHWRLVLLAPDRAAYGDLSELITLGRRSAEKGTYRLTRDDIAAYSGRCLALWLPGDPADPQELQWMREVFGDRLWIAVELLRTGRDRERLAALRGLGERYGVPLVAAGGVQMHARKRRRLHDVLAATRLGTTAAQAGLALAGNAERRLRLRSELAEIYPAELLAETLRVAERCTFSLDELRYEYPEELVPAGETPASHLRKLTEEGLKRRWPEGEPAKVRALVERELALIRELSYEPYFLTVHDIVRYARSKGILCQGRGSAANSAVCFCLGITEVDPARIETLFERFISKERNEPPDIDVDFEHERREEVIQYVYDKYGRDRAALAATVITYRMKSAVRDAGKALGLTLEQVDRLAKNFQWWDSPSPPSPLPDHSSLPPTPPLPQSGASRGSANGPVDRLPGERAAKDGCPGLSCEAGGATGKRQGVRDPHPHPFSQREKGASRARSTRDSVHSVGEPLREKRARLPSPPSPLPSGTGEGGEPRREKHAHSILSERLREVGFDPDNPLMRRVLELARELLGFPRHLSQHVGGFVISRGKLSRLVPIENAAMPERTVIQWDKDDLDALGLLKVDCLALGMLTAIRKSFDLIAGYRGERLTMATVPAEDPAVYEMASHGDTVGVFQIESRAQMAMLPRLRPACFYDLVIETAIVRPGPIQGNMVHPYLRRRQGLEPVSYPSEEVRGVLERTMGVPIFQEQVIKLAMVAAGFTPGEADGLRRSMAAWRRRGGLEHYERRLIEGMRAQGYPEAFARQIYQQILGFGEYGFPECVVGETRVVDADTGRWVTIDEAMRGAARLEHTLACGADLRLARRRVRAVVASGVKPVFRLRTALGHTLVASAEHPFLTAGGWRPLSELREGDHVAAARGLPSLGRRRWPRHRLVVLAGLIAEGNLCHPSTFYFYTTDPRYREEFVRAVERFPNTEAVVERHRSCFSVRVRRRDRRRVSGAVLWAQRLGIWGCGAREKRLPGEVFELCEADLALLLARLWEGDGGFSKAGHASYDTASRRLAEEVQHLLLRLGIVARIYRRVRPYRGREVESHVVTVTGSDALQRFAQRIARRFLSPEKRRRAEAAIAGGHGRMSRDVIPADVREIIRRERERLGLTWNAIGLMTGLGMREIQGRTETKIGFRRFVIARLATCLASQELACLAASDIYWDRVVAIEPLGRHPTYDLQIEGDHNFLANNLVVHNSHAASFALLIYVSAWLKRHEPAAFLAALLNSQPMGFYAPAQLVQDARRHGVEVRPVDVRYSGWDCTLGEPEQSRMHLTCIPAGERPAMGEAEFSRKPGGLSRRRTAMPRMAWPGLASEAGRGALQGRAGVNRSGSVSPRMAGTATAANPTTAALTPSPLPQAGEGESIGFSHKYLQPAVRLGLRQVKGLTEAGARRLVAARVEAPFASVADLARRAGLDRRDLDALAAAGALRALSGHRHRARWAVAGVERPLPLLAGAEIAEGVPLLRPPTEAEDLVADYASLGLTLGRHPLALLRGELRARYRCLSAADLRAVPHGRRARTAGLVVCRQHPSSASGVIFITLEDETGQTNLIVWPGVVERQRREVLHARLLVVSGEVQREGEVLHLIAGRLEDRSALLGDLLARSRDFH